MSVQKWYPRTYPLARESCDIFEYLNVKPIFATLKQKGRVGMLGFIVVSLIILVTFGVGIFFGYAIAKQRVSGDIEKKSA